MLAYCLFCQTQRCQIIAALLELREGVLRAFSPQIVKRQRKKGVNLEKHYDLLPGYVFLFAQEPLNLPGVCRGINGIIRRIGNADHGWQLTDGDLDFALNLQKRDGLVGQITLFKEGDKVTLSDPLFNGCEGRITQIDQRKQRARGDYKFAGMACFTWIACDLIDKIHTPGEAV